MFFGQDNYNRQNKCSHIIVAGDTLYSLAIKNNTTVDNLLALNPGINPYNLQIGSVIKVCGEQVVPPIGEIPGCKNPYHTIKQGDTLYSLARYYNTTVDNLLALNPGIDPYNLQIGSVIRICGEQIVPPIGEIPQPECMNLTYHTIKQGDTLYSLARYYRTTVDNILSYNEGIDPYNLQIGSTLLICVGDEYYEVPVPPIGEIKPPVMPVPPIGEIKPPVLPIPPILPQPPVAPPIAPLPPVMPQPPISPMPPDNEKCDKIFMLLWLLLCHVLSSRNMLMTSLNDLTCEKTAKQQLSTTTQNIIEFIEKRHGQLPIIASQANEMNTHLHGLVDAIKTRRTIEASKHRTALKQTSSSLASTIAKHTKKRSSDIASFIDMYTSSMENQALARTSRRFLDDAQLLDKLMLDTKNFAKNFHA